MLGFFIGFALGTTFGVFMMCALIISRGGHDE